MQGGQDRFSLSFVVELPQMKKILSLFIVILLFFLLKTNSYAIYDPHSVANNEFGIHILFPEELNDASELVNSNGGDWGYITIPIQSRDKDLVKWQNFMDDCKRKHLIPILRLATQGDYFNTSSWDIPDYGDVMDFANFLNSLNWPTKNRYVIIYNEVNRNDEWGGAASPAQYADILDYATKVFKDRSPDFFIISAGMDNAAANSDSAYNEYTFFREMENSDPGIFSKIDGMASHSYPNPGFSMPASYLTSQSIYSFNYEKNLLDYFAGKTLPVFITETGWDSSKISDSTQSQYYQYAFSNVWNEPDIVAVTPFIFSASQGPFTNFSFINAGQKTQKYEAYKSIPKVKGEPQLTDYNPPPLKLNKVEEDRSFKGIPFLKPIQLNTQTKTVLKWLLKI